MDSQQKKGLLELLVLASLKFEDSYGYLINQEINDVMEISESTLYPILRRLEKQGLLETYQTIHNSRVRKYYRITDEGLRKLKQSEKDFREMRKIYDYILR
ncbi:MAG: helix-turn-helix transcriptional regulator [Bacilli bacterium]|nr:helix-turn-helix transcriptional regulator [Bacilli bacterium]MBN2877073.1 helix-turn-helix transcriptional regulator [Bacilli bacterium]